MKYYAFKPGVLRYFGLPPKILLIMKMIVVLLTLCLMQVSAATLAQKLSYSKKGGTLEQLFAEITKQTGYFVVYAGNKIDKNTKLDVDFRNTDLKEVLSAIGSSQNLSYTLDEKNISLKPKSPSFLERLAERWASIDVTGRVLDEKGNPLPGATVKVKGKNQMTKTNGEGEFRLTGVEENALLEISYIGYVMQEVRAQKIIGIVRLKMGSSDLEEVEINKGYYNTTKTLNTGSISSVSSKDIERQPVSDPVLTLQGRVPGLLIQQTNGVPGRQNRIRLRGQNSMANGNDPLFIVDGVQYSSSGLNEINRTYTVGGAASPFNYLNPADIESIEVLKDADATSLYGSRGANGVILISTKKGHEGKTQINLAVYTGVSKVDKRVKFLNTQEYLAMRQQAFINDNKTPETFDYDINGNWDKNSYTNWQDILIGGTAPVTESSVSLSGGSKATTFRLASSYRNEGTIFPGDFSIDKASAHFNINHHSENNKLSASLTGSYVQGTNNLPVGGLSVETDMTLPPNAPNPFKSDGSLNWSNSSWTNPFSVYERSAKEKSNNLIANLQLSYRPVTDLEIKGNFGYNTTNLDQTNLTPLTAFDPALVQANPAGVRSHNAISNEVRNWIVEPQISYSFTFLKGKIDALVGSTFQSSTGNYLNINASGFQNDVQLENIGAATNLRAIKSENVYKYNAIYGRIGYSYLERYVLNFTGRRDGSSRFGPGNRFGNFGSFAGAWIFSKEKFFNHCTKWINFGKIRVSFGSTGNDQIGDYNFLDTYSSNTALYQGYPSLIPTKLTNPLYSWERVDKFETGIELGFFNSRVNLTANYYQNRTKNQLVRYGLPSVAGFSFVTANIPAVLQNSGLEFSVESFNINRGGFQWSTNISLSIPRSNLIRYQNLEASSYAQKFVVGMPTSLFFRYKFLGIDPSTTKYMFEDINKNGSITPLQDQMPYFIGQKYFGGIQNNLKYKGFELDFFFQFTRQNGDAFLQSGLPHGFRLNQPIYSGYEDYIQKLSTNNPDLLANLTTFIESDGIIKDASFISLKNLSFSYNIPFGKSIVKRIKSTKVFLQGQNIFMFSNYKGFNPESPNSSITIPLLRTITIGLRASI